MTKKKQHTRRRSNQNVKRDDEVFQKTRGRGEKRNGGKRKRQKEEREKSHSGARMENVLLFPDVLEAAFEQRKRNDDSDGNDEGGVECAFFELANATRVGFRLPLGEDDDQKNAAVIVRQDVDACHNHTGGIVWETSYLLATFLLLRKPPLGKTLEVGAGCGLLGLVLAAACPQLCESVVLTETSEALANLQCNVRNFQQADQESSQKDRHQKKKQRPSKNDVNPHDEEKERLDKIGTGASCQKEEKPSFSSIRRTTSELSLPLDSAVPCFVAACQLRWDKVEEDIAAAHHHRLRDASFDTIVGTDVIFRPNLVAPLLHTIRRVSHPQTTTWLCVQVRCADSHALLWEIASEWDLQVEDATAEFVETLQRHGEAAAAAAASLECKLLCLTRTTKETFETTGNSKKKTATTKRK